MFVKMSSIMQRTQNLKAESQAYLLRATAASQYLPQVKPFISVDLS